MQTLRREFRVSRFQTTQKAEEPSKKKWDTQVNEVHIRLINSTTIAKTDQDKMKQFAEYLKSLLATKIELKEFWHSLFKLESCKSNYTT